MSAFINRPFTQPCTLNCVAAERRASSRLRRSTLGSAEAYVRKRYEVLHVPEPHMHSIKFWAIMSFFGGLVRHLICEPPV